MKKKIVIVIVAGLLVVVIIVIIALYPFPLLIEKTITAYAYREDETVVETLVELDGQISGSVWEDRIYIGDFGIELYEKTCRDGVEAKIEWFEDKEYQSILFYFNGDFVSLGTSQIFISSDMTDFALKFDDGTVVATKNEMYTTLLSGAEIL